MINGAVFWDHLHHSITFLQPFSDFIHQIEVDCLSLGCSYVGIMHLDAHTPILHAAHVAAYLLDPMFAQVRKTCIGLPVVPDEHEHMVRDLIKRVGGRAAAVEFEQLRLEGYANHLK